MGQGTLYALDNLVLEVHAEKQTREDLDHLLQELSWVRRAEHTARPALHLSVSSNNCKLSVPANCREVLRTDDFLGFEANDDFYLTDRSSIFHLRPAKREGYARLAPSFFTKPALTQGNFWFFGLLKLLRPLGIFSLHGAGLSARDRTGLLLVGASGSGKSTLAIGLIREGYKYLSDDAVLLRDGSLGVEALACRRSFYVDPVRCSKYSDLLLGDEAPDPAGRERRRIDIDQAYPERYIPRCIPRIMIFPKIKPRDNSRLMPVDRVLALRVLLAQSAPQLFDRNTMAQHLELLKQLLQQTETYALDAGRDLYREPVKLIDLLKEVQGEKIGADRH